MPYSATAYLRAPAWKEIDKKAFGGLRGFVNRLAGLEKSVI
jgi:hypothetical protein